MRSIPWSPRRMNQNLRGRKTMGARCKCCVWQNFKEDYRRKLDEREMRDDPSGDR